MRTRTSLVVRLTAVVAAILATSFVAWVAVVHRSTAAVFEEQRIAVRPSEVESEVTASIAAEIEEAYSRGGWGAVEIAAAAAGSDGRSGILVVDAVPRVRAATDPSWLQAGVREDAAGSIVLTLERDVGGRVEAIEIAESNPVALTGPDGGVWARLVHMPGTPDAAAAGQRFASAVWRSAAVWLVGLVALAVVATAWVLRRALAPIDRLTHAARDLQAGRFPTPVARQGATEVDALVDAFNAATEAIARTEQLRRQLVADVAHELRTPITNIRGQLEAIQTGLLPADAGMMETLQAEARILERLAADLQEVALADAGVLRVMLQPLPLRATLESLLAPLASAVGAGWTVEGPADLFALVDEDRLRQVLTNLIENAARHRPEGLTVTVVCREAGAHAVFEVRDNGPGVAPADQPHVFERFYRAEKSRSRATGGAGLGLTIVRGLVEAMGGRIRYVERAGFGATFEVTLTR